MNITAYRICQRRFAASIWTGDGARQFGGRWNSPGVAIIYASENRSLAAMEQLVHLIKPRILRGFVISSIIFDDNQVLRIDLNDLPRGWNKSVAPGALKVFGDDWVRGARFPVLAVPSAVVPGEWNYLINPAHGQFAATTKTPPEPFVFDRRLG